MKFKGLYTVLILMLVANLSQAQTSSSQDDDYVLPFDSLDTGDKIHYNFEMGVGYSTSKNYGNGFNTYYKPSISYQVNKRFTLSTGLLYVNSSVNNTPVYSDYQYHLFSGNISEYYAYINGQYQLTDKLSVGGGIYYNMTNYNAYNGINVGSTNNSSLDNIGYSANFKYKVTEGFTITGEFRVRSANNYNPFNRNQAGSYNSPFRDSFGYPFRTW